MLMNLVLILLFLLIVLVVIVIQYSFLLAMLIAAFIITGFLAYDMREFP